MPKGTKKTQPGERAYPIQWKVSVGELLPAGAALLVGDTNRPGSTALFVRLEFESLDSIPTHAVVLEDKSVVVAYLNVCTHMGCSLVRTESTRLHEYQPGLNTPSSGNKSTETKAILGPCPCHGTTFDLVRDGMVLFGQATKDLVQLELSLKDSELTARLADSTAPFHEQWPNQ